MRILVVEDEHKIAQSLKKGLEQESFVVDVAYDGKTGYDLASSEMYDLIILDRLLPEMEGLEVCDKLRKHNIHTPILMLTAKGQIEDRVQGLNTGADDYLVKPFAFAELLARIRALARRPRETAETVLVAGKVTLNTVTHEVTIDGDAVIFSNKEYALLDYLLRHKNAIVTKEQIMDNVWDYDADILPNSVEVYIRHLRNKIGQDTIQTIRGFGYKLVE